jgi:translation initiation factor 2 alpha subunit (eIF-2alpha)
MNRYYCLDKLEQLTDDFIFQNKDIDPNIFYEKFLWVMANRLDDMDNIIENQFDEFMKDIPKMFALSELDEPIVAELTKQLSSRITCSEISMYGTIDILVTSAHGQLGTIKLIDKLIELVSHCYYRNAPTYGFIIKNENEKECRNRINNIKQVLVDYANSLELRAVIECDYNNIDIRDCVIKLTPLKKTHSDIPATTD